VLNNCSNLSGMYHMVKSLASIKRGYIHSAPSIVKTVSYLLNSEDCIRAAHLSLEPILELMSALVTFKLVKQTNLKNFRYHIA
jgi:hypothetical protein